MKYSFNKLYQMNLKTFLLCLLVFISVDTIGQVPMSEYLTFNGHYDFTMFGQSNNIKGNSTSDNFTCNSDNKSTSSADFNLPSTATGIRRAILYWSGSGTGDLNVDFTGPSGAAHNLDSEKTYSDLANILSGPQPYFCASYDVTDIILAEGNGTYTINHLDVDRGPKYCPQTLYSGWVVVVIFEDPTLPLNTTKLYDGFRGISSDEIDFNLDDIRINTPIGAKLGFVVWEGDNLPSLGFEGMQVNGNDLSNAQNPPGELFNSTNSFAGTNNYNMDMDYFDISAYVNAGDSQIQIKAVAGNDVIFFNIYAITVNNELPDATVQIKDHVAICDDPNITINYTVYNAPANDTLPANIDISFYVNSADGILLGTQKTPVELDLGDSINQSITLLVPPSVGTNFTIVAVAEDGQTVIELNEDNNLFSYDITVPISYEITDDQVICDGDTLFWGVDTFTTAFSKDFPLTTNLGCDSLIHLNVIVNYPTDTTIFVDLCRGDFYLLPSLDTVTSSGTYITDLSTIHGCDSTVIVELDILNKDDQMVVICDQEQVDLGYPITLQVSSNYTMDSIRWLSAFPVDCDSCEQTTSIPTETTYYIAFVFDEDGCMLTDSVKVRVFKHQEVYIPNAFSPNGDGPNELFQIFSDKDVQSINQFQVFDRWGSMVYDAASSSTPNQWNGDYNGRPANPGVYVYQILVEFIDGQTKYFSGDVTLFR